MLKKVFFIVAAFILISSADKAYAQQNQFGYVNIANAMLLHPTMQYFDSQSKRFRIEAYKGVIAEERIEENRLNFRKEMNRLEDELKALEAKRIENEEIYAERSEHMVIPDENLKKMGQKEIKAYETRRAKLDKDFYDEADRLRVKIIHAKDRIKNYEKNAIYTNYLSQGETSQLFSQMLDDVYEAVNAVVKRKKLAFVFNSSSEISYTDGNVVAENRLEDFFKNFKETIKNPDGKTVMAASFKSWLQEKNTAFWNCSDSRISSFVLYGGEDLTVEVIDHIYAKYKIGKEQRDFIKEYFEKIDKLEDGRFK